ncbi:MAG: tRNA (N(6)-L-threonylcarbamoyladenosine(37)-C(2))-methylthiotransferase MtaB [Treponemataceae bacterium]
MSKTIHFETLGCKLNQIESESACKIFSNYGWEISVEPVSAKTEFSDELIQNTKLCVVNTCTVTAKAEQKCRRIINLLLKTFPQSVIIVTGCYAQVEEEFISKINERVAVLPGTKKDFLADLPDILNQRGFDFFAENENCSNSKTENLVSKDHSFLTKKNAAFIKRLFFESSKFELTDRFKLSTDTFFNHSRSSIKIQDGCENACAFCRIHIARGKSVSLDANIVLDRIRQLEKSGQSEVVLTGVNLSQYRSGFPSNFKKNTGDFSDLLEFLNENTDSIYFRISSLYPQRIDEKFCDVLKKSRVRPHFHISLQSGSDDILEKMNRPYKASQVFDAVTSLRKIFDEPFIACDIIAGFPGESEEDFAKTMELCDKCNFSWIHAFPFSPRPGTQAFSMKNQIPQHIVHKRIEKLTKLADKKKKSYVLLYTGKTVKAVVEKRSDKLVRCVTENFLHAHLQLEKNLNPQDFAGKEVTVKILGVSDLPECECECSL